MLWAVSLHSWKKNMWSPFSFNIPPLWLIIAEGRYCCVSFLMGSPRRLLLITAGNRALCYVDFCSDLVQLLLRTALITKS